MAAAASSARWRYIPELLSALTLSTLSVHLFYHRRASQSSVSRLSARTSILQDLADRLRSGERVPLEEIGRVVRLVSSFPGYAEAFRNCLDAILGWLNVERNIRGAMKLLSSRRMKTLSALAGVAEPEVRIGVAVVDKSTVRITASKGRRG